MATVKEDYVSSEIAKLLEEKGFNEPCLNYYKDSKLRRYFREVTNKEWGTSGNISAPTLWVTMKWLRKKYNINIDVFSIWNKIRWEYQIFIITPTTSQRPYVDDKLYMEKEKAVEAAIKHCLENLI